MATNFTPTDELKARAKFYRDHGKSDVGTDLDRLAARVEGWLRAGAEADKAVQAAYDWLADFGADAPIVFGGEAQLAEVLRVALEGYKPYRNGD